jgi:DedD protein
MGLFSFLRKKNQESVGDSDGEFQPRAEAGSSRGKRKRGQDSDAVDPVLPEKKRARRRLVGAIALVLAAIIGLPMILDSEPKPLAEDIAIQIPAKDKPATTGAIRPAPSPASAAPVSAPKTAAAPAVAGLDKGEEIIDPAKKAPAAAAAAKPATIEAKPAAKAEPKAETKVAAVKSPEKPNTKSEAKPDTKPNDTARALAILDGKPEAKVDAKPAAKTEAKAADKKPGKYVVQVAALGSQAKVNELQNKLKGAGIQSYTQTVPTESGDRIRVRVGPFGSKEEAEKTRAKLVKLGLNGTLVPT